MRVLSVLGVLAGVFSLVPKGTVALGVIWAVGKVSPVIGTAMFAVFVILGGAR